MVVKTVNRDAETYDKISLLDISKKNLIEYANAVILDRALPDYRDGLKPVHRRILWTMFLLGLKANGTYAKSARVVGEVMGRFHPHGDLAIYGALVKMTHLPVTPIAKTGNFGTLTEKKFAAMRYTEVKFSPYGEDQFFNKHIHNLVPFQPNYDGKDKEPLYLPCLMPNLLLNGTEGIAVGITSKIPPLTLESLVPFLEKAINGQELKAKDLARKLQFNWEYGSSCINDQDDIINWIENGYGSLVFEPSYELDAKTRTLAVTEAPPSFNWDTVVQKITSVNKKTGKPRYSFVSSVDDMSDKNGIRFEVKFKNTIDQLDFSNHAKTILKVFTNSFSCATNITLRKTNGNKFFRSNMIDLIERWCRYRINLETKIQTQYIAVIDKELERFGLLLKVIENRHMFEPAWKAANPDDYLIKHMKLSEDEAKIVLSWNLKAPSNLNKDKILADKAALLTRRKEHVVIQENPAPTVVSYLSAQTSKAKD